uniref:Uncharacterized protein n=1 Tax=Neospora caninum (strain Liverpool) TaxID=572307 RepID=F0JB81_NEOCL|nr:hypothetical protein, conserved [Neospora caninum Liverpool]CEL71348.1 TPA: hypothetical protein, conserved [Neospora caninum Liverpool]
MVMSESGDADEHLQLFSARDRAHSRQEPPSPSHGRLAVQSSSKTSYPIEKTASLSAPPSFCVPSIKPESRRPLLSTFPDLRSGPASSVRHSSGSLCPHASEFPPSCPPNSLFHTGDVRPHTFSEERSCFGEATNVVSGKCGYHPLSPTSPLLPQSGPSCVNPGRKGATYSFDAYPPEVFSRWQGRARTGESCGLIPTRSRGKPPFSHSPSPPARSGDPQTPVATDCLKKSSSQTRLPRPPPQDSSGVPRPENPAVRPQTQAVEPTSAVATLAWPSSTQSEPQEQPPPPPTAASSGGGPVSGPSNFSRTQQEIKQDREPSGPATRAVIEIGGSGIRSVVIADIDDPPLRLSPYLDRLPRANHPLVLSKAAVSASRCWSSNPENAADSPHAGESRLVGGTASESGNTKTSAGVGGVKPQPVPYNAGTTEATRGRSQGEDSPTRSVFRGTTTAPAAVPTTRAAGCPSEPQAAESGCSADANALRHFQQSLRSGANRTELDFVASAHNASFRDQDTFGRGRSGSSKKFGQLSEATVGCRDSMASVHGVVAPPASTVSKSLRHDEAVLRERGIRIRQRDASFLKDVEIRRLGLHQAAGRPDSKSRCALDSSGSCHARKLGGDRPQGCRISGHTPSQYNCAGSSCRGEGDTNSAFLRGLPGSASNVRLPKWMRDYGVEDPSLQTSMCARKMTSNYYQEMCQYNAPDVRRPGTKVGAGRVVKPPQCWGETADDRDEGYAFATVSDRSSFQREMAGAYCGARSGNSDELSSQFPPAPLSVAGDAASFGFPVAHFICSNCGATAVPPQCPTCGAVILQFDGATPVPVAHLMNDADGLETASRAVTRNGESGARQFSEENEPQSRSYAPYDASSSRCRGSPACRRSRPHHAGAERKELSRGEFGTERRGVAEARRPGATVAVTAKKSGPPTRQHVQSSSPSSLPSVKKLASQVWGSPRVCAILCSFLGLPQLLTVRRCNKNLLVAAQFEMRYVLYATLQQLLREEATGAKASSPRPKSCEPPSSRGGGRGRALTPGVASGRSARDRSLPACPFNAETLTRLLELSPVELTALKNGKLPDRRVADAKTPRPEELRARANRLRRLHAEWGEERGRNQVQKTAERPEKEADGTLPPGLDEEMQLRREMQLQREEELLMRERRLQQQECELLKKQQELWFRETQQRLRQRIAREGRPPFADSDPASVSGAGVPFPCGPCPYPAGWQRRHVEFDGDAVKERQ